MSSIQEILASILQAVYGKDVRQAIHDGVEMAYNKAANAETSAAAAADAASGSQESAAASAQAASDSASSASDFADAAEQYKNEAFHTTPAGYEDFVSEVNSSLDYLANTGCKNLLHNTQLVSKEKKGVIITVNADGSITLNGTATEWFFENLDYVANVLNYPAGNYIGSGALSSGATLYVRTNSGSIATIKNTDTAFTIPANATESYVRLEITSGASFNNVTLYPMVRLASISDSTYQPYAQSNVALTENLGLIRRGRKQFSTSIGSSGSVNITFDFDFDKVPTVLYSIRGNDGIAGVIHTSINDVTSTGFKLNWKNTGSAGQAYSPYIEWVAIMCGTRYDDNT